MLGGDSLTIEPLCGTVTKELSRLTTSSEEVLVEVGQSQPAMIVSSSVQGLGHKSYLNVLSKTLCEKRCVNVSYIYTLGVD